VEDFKPATTKHHIFWWRNEDVLMSLAFTNEPAGGSCPLS